MILHCSTCNTERVWAKTHHGTWTHTPPTWTIERLVGGMWELTLIPAIECPVCLTRRDPKTLHLLSPRRDYYDQF